MMPGNDSYWRRLAAGGTSRRRLLRGAALTATGGVGLALVGCSSSNNSSSKVTSVAATATRPSAAAATSAVTASGGSPTPGATKAAGAQPKRGGALRLSYGTSDNLDLHQSNNANTQNPAQFSIEQLMTYDEPTPGDLKLAPMLAESLEQPDDQTYLYHLRKGVKFHNVAPVNGRELVADDVIYSFKRNATNDPKFTRRSWFAPVSAMDAVDQYTVRLKTSAPTAPLAYLLGSPWIGIIAKEQVERDGGTLKSFIGSGPYVNQRADLSNELTFSRNPDYWNKDAAYFDTVDVVNLTDPTAYQSAFRAGQVQVITGLAPDILDSFGKQNPAAQRLTSLYPGIYIIAMNNRRKPFTDKRVRQAIAYTCDLPGWIATVVNGQAHLTGPIAPDFTQWGLPKDKLKYGKQDLAQAKQLFSAAGVDPKTLSFSSNTNSGTPAWVSETEQFQADLKQLGITVQILPGTSADYTTRLSVSFDFDTLGGADFSLDDPDRLTEVFASTGSRNYSGYNTPELDALLVKQRQTIDVKARQQLAYQIQSIIEEDTPTLYTFMPNAFAFTQGLANWRLSAITGNDMRWNARYAWLTG